MLLLCICLGTVIIGIGVDPVVGFGTEATAD